jgi:AraC-like DNA-binding protein
METVAQYSQNKILVIPQSLYAMSDINVLFHHGNSGIFYKDLAHDLVDVEFYTNIPCVIYIESGQETIVTPDNKTYILAEQTAIFLPQGINLHSDYVKSTDNLKAYLVFFADDIITDFVSSVRMKYINETDKGELLKIDCGSLIKMYFNSIQLLNKQGSQSPELIRIKLLELLHLLHVYDRGIFQAVLHSKQVSSSPKRNLTRLLNNSDIFKLTVDELAHLSGRSVSTFTRDFKVVYETTPKKWLQNKRLTRANELLRDTELTVTHVAADLGYENTSHFIKSFKDKYQVTPKQFKKTID